MKFKTIPVVIGIAIILLLQGGLASAASKGILSVTCPREGNLALWLKLDPETLLSSIGVGEASPITRVYRTYTTVRYSKKIGFVYTFLGPVIADFSDQFLVSKDRQSLIYLSYESEKDGYGKTKYVRKQLICTQTKFSWKR